MLGAAVGVVGTLQATEVLKEIVGIGDSLAGRLLLYDAQATRFSEIKFAWDPANPLSGTAPTIRDLSSHQAERVARSAWPDRETVGRSDGDPGILFDKDGTLIDYERTWVPINRHVAPFAAGGDAACGGTVARASA